MGDGYAAQPWLTRLVERWGHHGATMLCASVLGVIMIGLRPLSGPFMLTVPLALFGFVVVSWLLMRQHDRRLCEQCALEIPLNPGERAGRYRRRFRLAHSAAEPRFLVPYLAVLISSNFATSPIGRIGWALVQSSMIYLILSYTTHRKLQPWCPWCRNDGGDDDDEDIAPPPPPVDRRLLI